MSKYFCYITALMLCLGASNTATAEQTEERYQCESILVAEYTGAKERTEKDNKEWPGGPPTAYFHIIEILKGPPLKQNLAIRYDLDDGRQRHSSDCKFDVTKLPAIGSKWIIFIPKAEPSGSSWRFETFYGINGRVELSASKLDEVREKVSQALATPGERATSWASWHTVIDRYLQHLFELGCAPNHGPSLSAEVAYTITKDGRIISAHLIKPSQSEAV